MPSFSFRLTLPSLVTQRDFLVIGLLYDRRQMLALHSDGYCRPNGCARFRSIDCLLYPLFCLLSFYLYLSSTVLDISAHPWRLLDDEPSTACPIAALHRSYLFCKILSFLAAFSFAIFYLVFSFFSISLPHTTLDLKRHLIHWLKELDCLDIEVISVWQMQHAKFWTSYMKGKKHSCGIESN